MVHSKKFMVRMMLVRKSVYSVTWTKEILLRQKDHYLEIVRKGQI